MPLAFLWVLEFGEKMKYLYKLVLSTLMIGGCASAPIAPPKSVEQFFQGNPEMKREITDYKLVMPPPIFPLKAADKKQQGWCVVSFSITPEGNTQSHKIRECSPTGYFETAALEAAKGIKASNPPPTTVKELSYTFHWKIAN